MNSHSLNFIVFVMTILIIDSSPTQAQNHNIKNRNIPTAYISFSSFGLGSNRFKLQPNFVLKSTKFIYSYQSNIYKKKKDKIVENISSGVFRQSSIDSIIDLVKHLKDTLINRTNPCMMSGGIDYLTISDGNDTTKFTLHNTSDYTALKIISIINEYLPADKKLRGDERLIKSEQDCFKWLQIEIKKRQDSIKATSATKNGT